MHIWLIPWFPSLLPPPQTYNNNKKPTTQNKNTPYVKQNVAILSQNKFNYLQPNFRTPVKKDKLFAVTYAFTHTHTYFKKR